MTSSKTTPLQSPPPNQHRDPSARLSLAIRKLDTLIFRLEHIGSPTNQSDATGPGIQLGSKNPALLEALKRKTPAEQ